MGNAGGSLRFGPDEDKEGEEDGGEHISEQFSQTVEMSGIHIADKEEYVDTASNDYAAHAEFKLVSVCTLGERPKITACTPYAVIRSAVLITHILILPVF